MKNPHGVEPTRYMKREESDCAIKCDSHCGPTFGESDIYIDYLCGYKENSKINNDGTKGYECHPQYKFSLFVNTAGSDKENEFSVLDYEVYSHN